MRTIHQVILKPVVTEKASKGTERGKYTFVVNKAATKIDVKNAIRSLYGVKAVEVNVSMTKKKVRVVGRGRQITKRDEVKKATVTLENGKTIDIFKFEKPAKK